MSRRAETEVSCGFVLLLLWFGVCSGWGLLAQMLCAAALHELGHLLTLWGMGGRVRGLHLGVLGAVLDTDRWRLTYGQELLTLLAGPGANLAAALCAALLAGRRANVWIGVNLALCAFNLLPILPLDGGQALHLAVCWMAGPSAALWAARCIGTSCALSVCCLLVWLMARSGGSLWLLPMAGGLCAAALRLWKEG